MNLAGSWASYLALYAILGFVATWHARRRRDELRTIPLLLCGALGLIAALIDPQHIPIFACVAVCAATDASSGYIYNVVLIIAGVVVAAQAIPTRAADALLGAATGFGISWLLYALTRGRGLGLGDVKLFAVIGAALGAGSSLVAFGLSFVIGAVTVLLLLALRVGHFTRVIRFAPYIGLATVGAATCHFGL